MIKTLEKINAEIQNRLGNSKESIDIKNVFINEIRRCNIDKHSYIPISVTDLNNNEQGECKLLIHKWLEEGNEPILFIVGDSGSGKTNALTADVIVPIVDKNMQLLKKNKLPQQTILFCPLGSFLYGAPCSFPPSFKALSIIIENGIARIIPKIMGITALDRDA